MKYYIRTAHQISRANNLNYFANVIEKQLKNIEKITSLYLDEALDSAQSMSKAVFDSAMAGIKIGKNK